MQGHHLLQRKRGLCYAIRAKANSFKISTELHWWKHFPVCCTTANTTRSVLQLGVFYLLKTWRRSNPHLILERFTLSFSNIPKKPNTGEFAEVSLLMRIWVNNWQKSDDLLIVHCTPANLRWRTAVQCTAHMLAMWREYLVKRNTSQAKVSEYHHQNIAAQQSRRGEEEGKATYEEEPMRGSRTNKQTTQVPLADWQIWVLLTT